MSVYNLPVLFFLRMFFSRLKSVRQALPLLLLIALIFLGWPTSVLAAKVNVRGVSGALADNVAVFLASVPDPQSDDLENYREQLKKSSLQALQAFGYYEPAITVKVEKAEKSYSAEIHIVTGNPVRVTHLDLQIEGEAQHDPEFQSIMRDHPLPLGDPFHHGKYEELKSRLSDLATSRGYFDAQWLTAKVEISIKERSAGINLLFDSKERYRFGEATISGAPELEELIIATQPFNVGDPYSTIMLADYNARLNDSNFFRTILVLPDFDRRADGVVPIIIQATPYAGNIVSVGGGFSTDIGLRGTLKWTVPRINQAGHSVIAELEISNPEQQATASYKIPLEDTYENYGLLQMGYKHRNNEDTDSRKYTLQAKRQRKLANQWARVYLLRYELEDFRQGEQRDWSSLILPGISFTRERSRGGLNVYWGDMLQFYLEFSDPIWGSDVRLAKVYGRTKWVRTAGDRAEHKFIARADLGAIAVESIYEVPASMRFFAGGDQSIRGFSYEAIAPRDEQGLLIGGRYLTVGSLEYSYLLLGKWRVASFIDVGTATNDFSEPLSIGSGVGLRWITPVGPLRLDLAFALSEPGKPWMIHFSMGPDI